MKRFRLAAPLAALLFASLAIAPYASAATYQQVGNFAGILSPTKPGEFTEDVQLGGVGGMAVNVSGAGGVPAGTLYAAGFLTEGELWVARFNPDGSFSEAWKVQYSDIPYSRCGPASGGPSCVPRADGGAAPVDVEVDQETGNVYTLNGVITSPGTPMITVFKADGSEVIARFGERAPEGKTTPETPTRIHRSSSPGGLAVGSDAKVFVFDINPVDNYRRLMTFEPEVPGDYEHYAYAGQGKDIGAGVPANSPSKPVTDAAGNIYVAGENYVEKYDPASPAAPTCTYSPPGGGVRGMTVNRDSGEVFYFSAIDRKIHQLAPCASGAFVPTGSAVAVSPKRAYLSALAFNPERSFLSGGEKGVLYGAAPSGEQGFGEGEPGMGSIGYLFAPIEENPPLILSTSVTDVATASAELHAQINPKGPQTTYSFHYITAAAYEKAEEEGEDPWAGAAEAPSGGAVLGVGQEPLAAAEALSGLSPDTEYRYRVTAVSHCSGKEPEKACPSVGPTQSFHTFAPWAPGLPDGRAFELVSPAIKNGGQVLPSEPETSSCPAECKPGGANQHFPMLSTPNGEAVVFEATPSFTPGKGAAIENEYRAVRTPAGWVSTNLTPDPMQSKSGLGGYRGFDPTLSRSVLAQMNPSLTPDAPPGYQNLYTQPTSNPLALEPLITEANATIHRLSGDDTESLKVFYAGASNDLSRIFFEANDALTEDAPEGDASKFNLYEWSAGTLHLVNFAPESGTFLGAFFGSGKMLKSGPPNILAAVVTRAISADGNRAFFSSESGQVYVREGGTQTMEIDDSGKFLSASADGSKVLLDDGCLYDLAEEECKDLTGGEDGFLGVAGESEDLSHVYFVDSKVLAGSEQNQFGDEAQDGKPNLYAWADGTPEPTTTFVATLVADDNNKVGGTWAASPTVRTAEASPAGRYLAFISRAPLSGVDSNGPCELNGSGEILIVPCPEAFLYDSEKEELVCASCNKTQTPPLGRTYLRLMLAVPGTMPQPRYLTDSGRLYFDSRDSLVPTDTNHGVEDVYQYEPEGIGGCTREGGCVDLISAGREGIDSNLVTIDQSGDNVFFTTRDRLVPADKDDLFDLYDARVGGGFQSEAVFPPTPCTEACQPTSSSPPLQPLATQGFQGTGNVKPAKPRCKKGKVRKRGRCVKGKRKR